MRQLQSENESNSVYDIIMQFKLLLLNGSDLVSERAIRAEKLLSFGKSIFTSRSTGEVFMYFLEHGAVTSWVLQVDLGMPEATAYRSLKNLRRLGVIEKAQKIGKQRRANGGPRPTLWGLLGCTPSQERDALLKHYRAESPKYRVAEKIAQSIIEDFLEPQGLREIGWRQMLYRVRGSRGVSKHSVPDLAELTKRSLVLRGIKVWK